MWVPPTCPNCYQALRWPAMRAGVSLSQNLTQYPRICFMSIVCPMMLSRGTGGMVRRDVGTHSPDAGLPTSPAAACTNLKMKSMFSLSRSAPTRTCRHIRTSVLSVVRVVIFRSAGGRAADRWNVYRKRPSVSRACASAIKQAART